MASKTPQRVDIQGLRALAVLLVLADHVGVGFLAGGYVGVDVFFVISGFLISSLLFAEIRSTGRVSIARFYARRARRILPASTVLLVTTLVFVAVTSSVTRVGDVIRDTLWAALFLANVNFARQGQDYSDMGASVSAVQHFWSLAVEEQFYLVWPALLLLLALLWRRRAADGSAWNRRILLRVVLVGFALSLLWSVVITVRDPQAAYFSTPARAWELAGGALVALLVPVLSRLRSWVRLVLSFGGVVAVAAAALRFDSATPFPGWVALLPVLGTMAILAAGTGAGQPWPGRLLTIPPGPWVGDISYSLYLWHWPVIVLGREQFPEATAGRSGTILLVAVSVLLAALSYYFVEEPFRRGRVPALSRGRGSLTLWPATAACVVLATLAAYGFAEYRAAEAEKERRAWFADRGVHISVDRSSGVREVQRALRQEVSLAREGAPLPPDLVNSEHLSRDLWQIEYPCRARWKQDTTRICPVGDTESDKTVVVYGDSHAGVWLPALDVIGRERGFRVVPLLKPACVPFDLEQLRARKPYPECTRFRAWVEDQLADLRPDLVVLSYRSLPRSPKVSGQTEEETWRDSVASALPRLSQQAPVLILSDFDIAPFKPPECLSDPGSTLADCTFGRTRVAAVGNRIVREVAQRNDVPFVDVTPLMCATNRCSTVVGDVATYRDQSHLTVTWVKEVSGAVEELTDRWLPGRA